MKEMISLLQKLKFYIVLFYLNVEFETHPSAWYSTHPLAVVQEGEQSHAWILGCVSMRPVIMTDDCDVVPFT
jgi:hypothetical protein